MLLASASAFAQPLFRNASETEIAGDWVLLPLTASLEPPGRNPWPAECQWFSYSPTGMLKSIDRLKGPCPAISSPALEKALAEVPAVQAWKYDMSPVYKRAVVLVTRSDVRGYMEVWDPQIVLRPFTKDGVEFMEGDLILYLANLSTHRIVWIRHLRRIE